MPTRLSTFDLDHIHSEAVWRGIGERLRDALSLESPEMSQRLRALVARLPELDGEEAQSIVPAISEETH